MTALDELIEVRHRSVRAVSLDADLRDPDVLRGYSPGAHVIDALRRITVSLQDEPRTRAWSITGPYGAGKSSFAHLLCSLMGSRTEPAYAAALGVLRAHDPQLADTLKRERRRLAVEDRGVIPAAVAGGREPIVQALLRALYRGAELYWSGPGRKPDVLSELREAVRLEEASAELVFLFLDELTAHAPVLVIVDELGKNLEYAADRPSDGDLYVMQRLAERFSSEAKFSGGILTLAHLAFDDYLVGAGDARRREWRKIHGRFEDIPFVSDTAHALGVLAEVLTLGGAKATKEAIATACEAADQAVRDAAPMLPTPATVTGSGSATYPLHPIVAVALPAIASTLAQHDRSLVAFLTSDAPHGLLAFLSSHELAGKDVPFLRLDVLYDYFFEDGTATALFGEEGDRAREIRARVDEAVGLGELDRRVLKTVSMLNLVGGIDKIVANAALIEESVVGPAAAGSEPRREVAAALERLTDRSLLTYRDFAGEYRVWQGSDFDARAQIGAARERLAASGSSPEQLLSIVAEARPLRPAVARRHSQQHHVLRYFASEYRDRAPDQGLELPRADADGLVAWVLSEEKPPSNLPAATSDGRPFVVVWSSHRSEVHDVALSLAAAKAVFDGAPELESDAVARRELRQRVASLQVMLTNRIDDAFDYRRKGVSWFVDGKKRAAQGQVEFSRLLSDLCDRCYPETPVIRNEMVNRRELTSQGAKARRVLLDHMLTHEHEARLAIDGYGPERAMYESVLRHTGLHAERDGRFGFGAVPKDSALASVWAHVMARLDAAIEAPLAVDTLFAELAAPPFGMKAGVIPLLVVAALQVRADDVFVYEDGSFQPIVQSAHIERLLKTPERFALKRASSMGLRMGVFEQLYAALASKAPSSSSRMRNQTTLAVVRPLVEFVTTLPEYTRQTTSTSVVAQQVCEALLHAREPDELLFVILPQACGLEPYPAQGPGEAKDAAIYVERLRGALAELSAAYPSLLERIGSLLHAAFAVAGPASALREDLRSRSRRVIVQVIEPKMRAFLMTAADEGLEDDDWLEALTMTLAAKPPSGWKDHDVVVFEALLAERAHWFRRLEVLHHQMHGAEGVAFDVRRVTISAPDGRETAELVGVDPATRELVADILDGTLHQLEQRLGGKAQSALLGILAERLLSTDGANVDQVPGQQPSDAKKAAKQ
jgi:hypothetical protein